MGLAVGDRRYFLGDQEVYQGTKVSLLIFGSVNRVEIKPGTCAE